MMRGTIGLSHPPKKSARSPSAGARIALLALSYALRGPRCFRMLEPSPSEVQIDAGDQTINFGSQSTFGRRPRRNVMFPPRLPPITALTLLSIGVFWFIA